jgi:hypothetical protein
VLYQLSYIGETLYYSYSSLSLEGVTSFRRNQVLKANMAKIAKHSSLILWSLSVVQARTPNPTNAAIAIAKRVTRILVHREGFEPSYLTRRDRFTVCWL